MEGEIPREYVSSEVLTSGLGTFWSEVVLVSRQGYLTAGAAGRVRGQCGVENLTEAYLNRVVLDLWS